VEEELLGWSSPGLVRLEEELLQAERSIALLGRLTPLNLGVEQRKVAEALSQGSYSPPAFRYSRSEASKPQLSSAAETLQSVEIALSSFFGRQANEAQKLLAELLMARVRELSLELGIVRAASESDLRRLAHERYFVSEEDVLAADRVTLAWLEETPTEEGEGGGEVVGLMGALAHLMHRNSYPFRVLEGDIASVAAVTDDCLVVQRGARGSAELVQRLFVHEVEGHLLPRWRARVCGPPFRIGTAGCNADEEGRALLLEKRTSTLDSTRRRVLAVRHRLARTVRAEGDIAECCADLLSIGIEAETLAIALCRILRGGGLAREIVYVPSYLRVAKAFEEYPEDERWLKQGRISVESARKLSVLTAQIR
jgi:hypothetical protein